MAGDRSWAMEEVKRSNCGKSEDRSMVIAVIVRGLKRHYTGKRGFVTGFGQGETKRENSHRTGYVNRSPGIVGRYIVEKKTGGNGGQVRGNGLSATVPDHECAGRCRSSGLADECA